MKWSDLLLPAETLWTDRLVRISYTSNGEVRSATGTRVHDRYVLTSPGCARGTHHAVHGEDFTLSATPVGPMEPDLPGLLFVAKLPPMVTPPPLALLGELGRVRVRACTTAGYIPPPPPGKGAATSFDFLGVTADGTVLENSHRQPMFATHTITSSGNYPSFLKSNLPIEGAPVFLSDGTLVAIVAESFGLAPNEGVYLGKEMPLLTLNRLQTLDDKSARKYLRSLTGIDSLRGMPSTLDSSAENIIRLALHGSRQHIDLSDLDLEALPEGLQRHSISCESLNLSGNLLSSDSLLPLAQFHAVSSLILRRNRLTKFPDALINMPSLEVLVLDHNSLRELALPPGATLPNLDYLSAGYSGVEQVDGSIARLPITTLDLTGNLIHSLPEFDSTSRLTELRLGENPGLCPGVEVVGIPDLRLLDLHENNLLELDTVLGHLQPDTQLNLQGNPLSDSIVSLAERGTRHLTAFLRTLQSKSITRYEARLVIVGDGNVGKTSMVDALRNYPFVPERETTHGIQIRRFFVKAPAEYFELAHEREYRDSPVPIAISAWDFGGQEVYRVTHQFFFSSNAIYIAAWRPREGQEGLEFWINSIAIRCSGVPKVLIVGTHGAERQPELDYAALKDKYGNLLVGHMVIDSKTRLGIDDLRAKIAEMASWTLPNYTQAISASWSSVEDALLGTAEPFITRSKFDRICADHGVSDDEGEALALLLADLGYIVYFADDPDLRGFIVVQPEWLTKAISHVLEDGPTRANNGMLEHSRLEEIWAPHGYREQLFPYFLRLMEKFDVSYRVPDYDASLIAQLVPYERSDEGFPEHQHNIVMYCDFTGEPAGLIPWMIVRTRRFSVGRHWRTGLYLQHQNYDAAALIQNLSPTRLQIKVTGGSRQFFFDVLRDTIEEIVRTRWPGISYTLRIPCPGDGQDLGACAGLFPVNSLESFRAKGLAEIHCVECTTPVSLHLLLGGFPSKAPLAAQLEVANRKLDEIGWGLSALLRFQKAAIAEVSDCPKLFSLSQGHVSRMNPANTLKSEFHLQLWCEEPGQPHPVGEPYTFKSNKKWFSEVAPYLKLMAKAVSLFAPIAGGVGGVIGEDDIRSSAALMKSVSDATSAALADEVSAPTEGDSLTPAEGAALRAFRQLLFSIDATKEFRGLRRALLPTGDYAWLCPDHYTKYEPRLLHLSANSPIVDLEIIDP